MKQRKLILYVLLLVFVLVVVSTWFRMPRQKSVEKLTYQQGDIAAKTRVAKPALQPGFDLRIELLEREPLRHTLKRNIFISRAVEQAKIAARKKAMAPPPSPPPPPPPPTPQEIARRQLSAFKSLGSLKKKNLRIAFLAKGNQILIVRIGDTLIPGYSVYEISDDQIKMKTQDGSDQLSIAIR